jgi:hypothetical protein
MFTIMTMTFLFPTKSKSRDFIAASAESLSFRYYPDDLLRFCPDAAKKNQSRPNDRNIVNRVIENPGSNAEILIPNPRALRLRGGTQVTGNIRERVIGVSTDQTHGPDYQYQNHGEHNGIFSDILPLVVRA